MSVTYIDAIRQAMTELLEEDPAVFLMGEDIAGKFGGAFKATKGLDARFPGRVLNAPIAEDAIMGMGIGAALEGMKMPEVAYFMREFMPSFALNLHEMNDR